MTSQVYVTTASLKHASKEYIEAFSIHLHLKAFCTSILETSHSKLRAPKQYYFKPIKMLISSTELLSVLTISGWSFTFLHYFMQSAMMA